MFSTKTKKPSPMLDMIATPVLAGVIAAGYNTFSESDDTYKNAMAFGMYAAIAAGANFAATQAAKFILPEFHDQNLRNVQHMALGGVGTAFLNILGQATLQSPKDLRTLHNGIAGAIGGAAAPLVSHQVLSMM